MARRMNIPHSAGGSTPAKNVAPVTDVTDVTDVTPEKNVAPVTDVAPVTSEREMIAIVETQKKIFDNIKSSLASDELEYANASDEEIYDSLSSKTTSANYLSDDKKNHNFSKFDTLINILECRG